MAKKQYVLTTLKDIFPGFIVFDNGFMTTETMDGKGAIVGTYKEDEVLRNMVTITTDADNFSYIHNLISA